MDGAEKRKIVGPFPIRLTLGLHVFTDRSISMLLQVQEIAFGCFKANYW